MTKLKKTFQALGLSEKQAEVYLASLEIGPASVQKIAQKARLPRSTVYQILESLQERGFASTFMKKKIRNFSVEDPEQIIRMCQSRVEMLKYVLPELNAIAGESRRRPTARFYQGKEEMKIIWEEMLAEADQLICSGSAEDLFKEVGDYFNHFVERRIKLKIPVRVILNASRKAEERKRLGTQQLRQVKIVPHIYSYHGNIFVWKNKIALFSFVSDFVAVVIESRKLAEIERAMFEHLWDGLQQ